MKELNLMPQWAKNKKQRQWLTVRLAILEAVIFLALVLFVGLVFGWLITLERQTAYLETALADSRFLASEQTAAALKEARAQSAARQALLETLPMSRFSYAWLDEINKTLPDDVTLIDIDIQRGEIIISAIAADFIVMEQHRLALSGGCFEQARLGSSARLAEGKVRYALLLQVK